LISSLERVMEEAFKNYLITKGVTEAEYNSGSLDTRAKLIEAFENSKKCEFSLLSLLYAL